jgi:hypothetical protein
MMNLAELDFDSAATRVEVVLREPNGARRPLAFVVRNLDGAHGRHILARANIPEDAVTRGNAPKMAGVGRTSALTKGSGQTNDIMLTLVHNEGAPGDFRIDETVPQIVKEVVSRVHDTSQIFGASAARLPPGSPPPLGELECTLRVHAFPPRDPAGASPATVQRMYWGQGAEDYREIRQFDDREGGRMHGHKDEEGTDAVVLLNLGAVEFFVDVGARRHLGKCSAQREKECWCVGGDGHDGHWARAADCEGRHAKGRVMWRSDDRLCQMCADGGRGEACPTCMPVVLQSGDIIAFDGTAVFHGVTRVLPREEPAAVAVSVALPELPRWAEQFLDRGFRLSIMWRFANRAIRQKKREHEQSKWHASEGLVGGVPAAAGSFLSATVAAGGADPALTAAIAASLSAAVAGPVAPADAASSAAAEEEFVMIPDHDELRRKRLAKFDQPPPPVTTAGDEKADEMSATNKVVATPDDEAPHTANEAVVTARDEASSNDATIRKRTRELDDEPTAGGWACAACTFVNENGKHLSCGVCRTERA